MSIENIVQTVMTSKKYSNIIPETINRICNEESIKYKKGDFVKTFYPIGTKRPTAESAVGLEGDGIIKLPVFRRSRRPHGH